MLAGVCFLGLQTHCRRHLVLRVARILLPMLVMRALLFSVGFVLDVAWGAGLISASRSAWAATTAEQGMLHPQ